MQKKLAIILILVLVIFGCGLVTIKLLDRVPENDAYITGNTSGNLNNEGYFCEDDGIIYFTNVYDNHYLYSMNADGSNVTCLLQAPVSYINSAGDYLYFYQEANKHNGAFGTLVRTNGIYRMKKDAKQSPKCLDRTPSKVLALCGNDLYYEHYDTADGLNLYNVSIRGGNRHMVTENDINPACVVDGNIFFPDVNNNFYMSCFRTNTKNYTPVSDLKVFNIQYDNNHLYFLNVNDDYKLYRYDIGSTQMVKLTNKRVDSYNVLNDIIFYQQNGTNDAALIRINSDGSNPEVVATGNYKNISITSNYTFFRPYDEDEEDVYFYTSTMGAPSPQKFVP